MCFCSCPHPAQLLTSANVSVFELLSSGAVSTLSSFLRGDDLTTPSPAREEQLLQRLNTFVQYALVAGSGSSPPLVHLVRKLQAALSSSEAFPVLCSRLAPSASMGGLSRSLGRPSSLNGSAGGAPGSLSSGLAALTQPFKLRLVRHSKVGDIDWWQVVAAVSANVQASVWACGGRFLYENDGIFVL